jgi:hypothetical protein
MLGHVRLDHGGTNGIHAQAFGRELQRRRVRRTLLRCGQQIQLFGSADLENV